MPNALYYGDNLAVLRNEIASESVDLIYLDPPFNSQATNNVLFRSPTGERSQSQIEAFEDTWHWGQEAEDAFDQVMMSGSLYLHCDPTASHYLKLVMDAIFGADKYLNEVIWKRTSAHANASRRLG